MMAGALTAPIPVISSSPGQPGQQHAQVLAAGGVAAADLAAGRADRGGARDGRQVLLDLLVQQGDLGVDRVDQPQVHRDLGGVDVTEPAGQRRLQLGGAGLEPVVAERGQRLRAALPGDEGVQEPPPAGPEQVGDHHRDLHQRVLEDLLHPGLVPGLVLGQLQPGPGQRPQVPDRLGRHERTHKHPPLVQLAVPHAVQPVAFAPPGQVLDVAGVDQPHLQAGRLGQVVKDTPVVRGRLQYQPLDALAAQVVHQRGHLLEGGLHPPHLLPPAIRAGTRHPGTHHPEPLRHVDRGRVLHDLRALLGHLRAVTTVHGHRAGRAVPGALVLRVRLPRGHRRLAFPGNRQEPAARGAAREETESDRRARRRQYPSPHDRPQRQTFLRARKRQAEYGVTGSTPRSCPPARPCPPPVHKGPARRRNVPGWTTRP